MTLSLIYSLLKIGVIAAIITAAGTLIMNLKRNRSNSDRGSLQSYMPNVGQVPENGKALEVSRSYVQSLVSYSYGDSSQIIKELKKLFDAGYDPNTDINPDLGHLLWYACAHEGSLEIIKFLASDPRTKINRKGRSQSTALAHAARLGRADVVEYLIGLPEINLYDNYNGYSVLHCAAIPYHTRPENALQTINCILRKHPTLINSQSIDTKETPLITVLSSRENDRLRMTNIVDIVRIFLANGADPRIPNKWGETPLKKAEELLNSSDAYYSSISRTDREEIVSMIRNHPLLVQATVPAANEAGTALVIQYEERARASRIRSEVTSGDGALQAPTRTVGRIYN